jgi:homopolymeric O-antigen transport system permease protein
MSNTRMRRAAPAPAPSRVEAPHKMRSELRFRRRDVLQAALWRDPAHHLHLRAVVGVYVDLVRFRELFASLFRRDLRAKYKGSVLGLAWTLAHPLVLMAVYLVVFSVLWRATATDFNHYWLFLLSGLPPWVFFATSLQTSSRSLLENATLIRKVRFPRQLVPLSMVATQLVAFGAMLVVVVALCLAYLPEARDMAWLAVPAAAVFAVFVGGVALAIASANAVFRDVEHLLAALLLPWFFLTPILYRLEDLPGAERHPWLADLIHWGNPLTPAIETIRTPLFFGEAPPAADAIYLAVEAVVALALGALVFTRVDDRIAVEV